MSVHTICGACGKIKFKCRCPAVSCCADCGGIVGADHGPPDGWQLEDGRTVCHACCVVDTKRLLISENPQSLHAGGHNLREAGRLSFLQIAHALRIDKLCSSITKMLRRWSS